ncbi:MAG: ComEC/Rec2 family competence protein, partial [Lentisphaeria bacterium]|nr:ComEC/Rec2 family competence protein [Lentisphaeria bacterium]
VTGNPAIASLAAVIALLLLVFCAGFAPWLAGMIVLLIPFLFLPVRTVLCCIVPALAAVLLSLLLQPEPAAGLEDDLINRRAYGKFEVQVTDRSADPAGPAAKMIRAEIRKYRLSGEEDWIEAEKPLPIGLTGLEKSPGYGDRLLVHGFLFEPDPPLLPGSFNYKEYLAREGITFLLRRDKDVEPVHVCRGGGVSRFFYDLRSRALVRMTDGMKSEEAKALASGIFFGISRDLSPETKQDFLRSGTIHILTVSGTHVGFFALLVFWLCPFLSFRGRAVCVILLTACYVWLTGLNEPSIRAWIMLSCFQLVRIFRFHTKSLNTLALAALILLIADPDDLFSTGFQFSFLVVAVLLMSIPLVKEVRRTLFPDHLLVPASRTPQFVFFLRDLGRRLLGAVLATGVAALAGTALAAYYQGLFSGSSVLANFLLLPAVALSFPAAVLAGISGLFVPLLENLLLLILAVNRSLAETGVLTFARPPLWSVILMTVLILVLFLPARGFRKIPVACGILLIPVWWHFRTVTADPELLILHGKDRSFVFVLTEPDRRSAVVVNMPDYATAAEVSAFLRSRGIPACRV